MENELMVMYQTYFKRCFDLVSAVCILVLFWWLYPLLALLVLIRLGRPVLFAQQRTGRKQTVFTMYKFRSMTLETDQAGNPLPDEYRLTRFGAALRKTKLDEMPQIFHILRGKMSFVGPRPLLIGYLPLYTPAQRMRFNALPGLTGLAQIHGGNACPWRDKLGYDVQYVSRITFVGDVKILAATLYRLLPRRLQTDQTDVRGEQG